MNSYPLRYAIWRDPQRFPVLTIGIRAITLDDALAGIRGGIAQARGERAAGKLRRQAHAMRAPQRGRPL